MKKLLTVFALVLALTGCAQEPEVDETPKGPQPLQTLDVVNYAAQFEETTFGNIRYDLVVDETLEIEGRFQEEETEFVSTVATALKGLSLTKAESQERIYGTPRLYLDLHNVSFTNYARFAVYELEDAKIVEIRTNEGYIYYTVDDETQVTALYNLFITNYPVEA